MSRLHPGITYEQSLILQSLVKDANYLHTTNPKYIESARDASRKVLNYRKAIGI